VAYVLIHLHCRILDWSEYLNAPESVMQAHKHSVMTFCLQYPDAVGALLIEPLGVLFCGDRTQERWIRFASFAFLPKKR
jgi:hypothetical protein